MSYNFGCEGVACTCHCFIEDRLNLHWNSRNIYPWELPVGRKVDMDDLEGSPDLEEIPLSPMTAAIYAAPRCGRVARSVRPSSDFWSKTLAHIISANQGRLSGLGRCTGGGRGHLPELLRAVSQALRDHVAVHVTFLRGHHHHHHHHHHHCN